MQERSCPDLVLSDHLSIYIHTIWACYRGRGHANEIFEVSALSTTFSPLLDESPPRLPIQYSLQQSVAVFY